MARKSYVIEILICVVAVAIVELAYYLSNDDTFSLLVYLKSVLEIYFAPIYPGIKLIYPSVILILLLGLLAFLSKTTSRVFRMTGVLLIIVTWVALGFITIINYYE